MVVTVGKGIHPKPLPSYEGLHSGVLPVEPIPGEATVALNVVTVVYSPNMPENISEGGPGVGGEDLDGSVG